MILDLINKDKSEIKYVIHQFPDGEKHFEFLENVSNSDIRIKCRIKSGDDLFVLLQILDIIYDWQLDNKVQLDLYYLMSMRMDRAMSKNRAFSLSIVIGIITLYKSSLELNVNVYEPHSEVVKGCFDLDDYQDILLPWLEQNPIPSNALVCFPDKGAKSRYARLFPNNQIIYGDKVRNEKGEIVKYALDYNGEIQNGFTEIYVIDDLCDGGGTFVKLAEELNTQLPGIKKTLCVTHMIQIDAILKLRNYYDQLVITNSFSDWDVTLNNDRFDHVKVIDIIS